MSAPFTEAEVKQIVHLLGEAFPRHFTVTLAFPLDESGCVAEKGEVAIVTAPKCDCQRQVVAALIARLAIG